MWKIYLLCVNKKGLNWRCMDSFSWSSDDARCGKVRVDHKWDKGVILTDLVLLHIDPSSHHLVKRLLACLSCIGLWLRLFFHESILEVFGEVHDHVNPIHVLLHLEHEELDIICLVRVQCNTATEDSILIKVTLICGLLHCSPIILHWLGSLVSDKKLCNDLDWCQSLSVLLKHEQVERRCIILKASNQVKILVCIELVELLCNLDLHVGCILSFIEFKLFNYKLFR